MLFDTNLFSAAGFGPPAVCSSSSGEAHDAPPRCSPILAAVALDQVDALAAALADARLPLDGFLEWRGADGSSGAPPQQRTLLSIAAHQGALNVMAALLAAGANPRAASPGDGSTPLHCAAAGASGKTFEAIQLLLSAGADKDALDAAGRKPVDLLLGVMEAAQATEDAEVRAGFGGARGASGGEARREQQQQQTLLLHRVLRDFFGRPTRAAAPLLPLLQANQYGLEQPEYCTNEFRMYGFKVRARRGGEGRRGASLAGAMGGAARRVAATPQNLQHAILRPARPLSQVVKCPNPRAHDWTECPYAHPGGLCVCGLVVWPGRGGRSAAVVRSAAARHILNPPPQHTHAPKNTHTKKT